MVNGSTPGMRILGVDPGSRKTGWGLIEVRARGKIVHVDHGVLRLDTKAELPERLVELSRGIHGVTERARPHLAALEDVFGSKGIRSALILGQARGAVLATLGLCGVRVMSHTPSQVKSRVAGTGRATKDQVGEMVRALLGLDTVPYEDAADALAVAICQAVEHTAVLAAGTHSRTGNTTAHTAAHSTAAMRQLAEAEAALHTGRKGGRGSAQSSKGQRKRAAKNALAALARAQGKL